MAGPPAIGNFSSNDLGGVVLTGRFSESWMPGGDHGQIGNTTNAMSWDGSVLGSEWKVWCMSIAAAPFLVADTRDMDGTGEVTWRTDYAGGMFFLSKNGPWGDGSEDYTGTVLTFRVTTTYHYVMGGLLGIRSNVVMSGYFDGYDNCMDYTINNAAFLKDTNVEPLPSDFPPFLDSSCATGVLDRGGWGTVTEIALTITGGCTVPTDESSWGAIKALYQD